MKQLDKRLHSNSLIADDRDGSATKIADACERIKAYEAAHNAHDVGTTMALFAENAVFEWVGHGTFPNLEAIRALHEYDKAIHAQTIFQNCVVAGHQATCQVAEQNAWLTTAGLGEIFYPSSVFTFTPSGKIQKITATLSTKDSVAMGAVLAEFVPWLVAERPEESRSLFTTDGVFIYSEANGTLVIKLLAQWRARGEQCLEEK